MSEFFAVETVHRVFEKLVGDGVTFLLLRNIDSELPAQLSRDKDIDILVHPSSLQAAHRFFQTAGFKQIRHPWNFGDNFVFLYSMTPFRMYDSKGLHFDVAYQLACRSPNRREWTPLDQWIQDSAWENRREEPGQPWKYRLGYEDEAVHLLSRCIFDKKGFPPGYRHRLEELERLVNVSELCLRLELVFFKFTTKLMGLLKARKYDEIHRLYLQFADY